MDLATVITGFVVVTTAIFGFSQYFYSRISDKNTKLLDKIDDASKILPYLPDKDVSSKITTQFYQYHPNDIEDEKTKLDDLRLYIAEDWKKKTLIYIIYSITFFYVIYLVFYGLVLFLNSETYFNTVNNAINTTLGGMSIILNIIIITILSLVKSMNKRQRENKKEIERVLIRLKELVSHWNIIKKNDQESIEGRETIDMQKILSDPYNNIPNHLLDKIKEIISNYFNQLSKKE